MIQFRTGSQLHRLMTILAITGEFPYSSLRLLGNERRYKALVHKLTTQQTIRNSQIGIAMTPSKVLTVNGKKSNKTVRLYKGAVPILGWIGAEDYYLRAFRTNNFSGNAAHVERNHRVAEAVAMFMNAGFEFREYRLPSLQKTEIKNIVPNYPNLYSSKSLKQIDNVGLNKTKFTRIVGAAFACGNCYAVYNTRGAVMKWNGEGESKARESLVAVCRLNAGIMNVDSAILFGESDKVALATMVDTQKNHRLQLRFDMCYPHIHFIPLNDFGVRQLRLLTVPNWKERLLGLLFEPSQRSFGRGAFEYDAFINGVYVYSYLDGDIGRLLRFRQGIDNEYDRYEVLCFEDQIRFVKEFFGELVQIRVIGREVVESALNLKRRDLLEEI